MQNSIRNGVFNTFHETPEQQQFVRNYSNYQPNSTFFNTSNTVSAYGQNMNSFSQNNLKSNFSNTVPLREQTNFTFNGNTLDPNLNSNLLSETLRDYRINIDSNSRNIRIYPNAYNYTVFFGPITNSTNPLINDILLPDPEDMKIYDINNNFIVNYNEKLKQSADPYISRNFTNVKYCRIDQLMLSKYNRIRINKNYLNYSDDDMDCIDYATNDTKRICTMTFPKMRYIPDMHIENSLFMDRYILLRIPELNDGRNLSTRNLQAYTIYPDKFFCFNWLGKPYFALKEWEDSALGNINKLTIELFNSDGEPLTINTSECDYELNYFKKINLLNPSIKLSLDNKNIILFYIRRITDIIKAVVLINHKITKKINFYNVGENGIILNKSLFNVSNLNEDLDNFCDIKKGFKSITIYNNKKIKTNINIDDYIKNIIWFDYDDNFISKEILFNIEILFKKYTKYIYNIINDIVMEVKNLPLNRYYQNNISLVISCATNNLNTKINYENGN